MRDKESSVMCDCRRNTDNQSAISFQKLPTTKRRGSIPDKLGNNVCKLASRLLEPLKRTKPINIAILGARGCGKTSVVRRFAGDMFYEKQQEPMSNVFRTCSVIDRDHSAKGFDVTIVETSRHRCPDLAYRDHIKSANAFVLVYSMDDFSSVLHLAKILSELHNLKKTRYPIIVIGNKTDLIGDDSPWLREKTDFELQVEFSGHKWFRVSAKENEGILEAFTELTYLHSIHKKKAYRS